MQWFNGRRCLGVLGSRGTTKSHHATELNERFTRKCRGATDVTSMWERMKRGLEKKVLASDKGISSCTEGECELMVAVATVSLLAAIGVSCCHPVLRTG